MSDDGSDKGSNSPAHSRSEHHESEERKILVTHFRSRSKEKDRSRTRSPSVRKSKKKYSRSRSRSRSRRSYRAKNRNGSKYRRYSRSGSRSDSYSPPHHRRGRGRTYSRSPMSNRRRHKGDRENPEPSRCLGVFGLSIYTTESHIRHIFSKYGPVESVYVVIDVKTGHSRGFCFVYFKNYEDARVAKEECTGMEIDGRKIRVDYSITQRAHTPTPGIYMGKPTHWLHPKDHRGGDWGGGGGGRDYYGGGGGGGGGGGYRGGGGGGGRYRSPSPYYSGGGGRSRSRYERSRSRSYSADY